MTATDASIGTASMSAISTVGIEISASIATTEPCASAEWRETIIAISSRPNVAAKATVSSTMSRLVREPAMSQLNRSAPVPSVPSQWAREGADQTW